MLQKTSQGHCPDYFASYFKHGKHIQGYVTRYASLYKTVTQGPGLSTQVHAFYGII